MTIETYQKPAYKKRSNEDIVAVSDATVSNKWRQAPEPGAPTPQTLQFPPLSARMSTYISSVTFPGRDRTGRLRVLDVSPPIGSVMRGWQDRNSVVTDLFQRVYMGSPLFEQNDVLIGSDPTFTLTDTDHSYNYFRMIVHRVYGGATPEQRSNANYLRREFYWQFNTGEAIMRGYAVGVFRSGRRNGVFNIARTEIGSQLFGTAVSRGGRMGIRRGNASFMATEEGQVAEVRKALILQREGFLDVLRKNPSSCLFAPTLRSDELVQLSPDGTLDVLVRCSCVILGYWLRFSRGPLTNAILERINQEPRTGKIGTRLPTRLNTAKSKLLVQMVQVIAGCRGKSPFIFWSCDMDEPVVDTEIFALCKHFGTNILVIETGAFTDYKEAAEKEGDSMAMLAESGDIEILRRANRDLRVMIYFKGTDASKFDRRQGHCMVMICSYLCEIDAHVDVVFNPETEACLLGGQYNRFTYEMTYDEADNPRAQEGYFDRLISERKPTPFVARRRYHMLESWDVSLYITKDPAPRFRFINTADEFVAFKDEIIAGVSEVFKNPGSHPMFNAPIDNRAFGTHVLIDIGCVQDIAMNLFEMEERRIKGLVYFLSEFYRAFEECGVKDKIDFSRFASTMSNTRTARLFEYQTQLDADEDGRMDCISGFDDLYSFSLSFKTPIKVRSSAGNTIGVSKLFQLSCYSKSAFEVGKTLVKEEWIQKKKVAQMWKVAQEVASGRKGVNRTLKALVFNQKCNDPNLDDFLALGLTSKSIALARLGGYGSVLERINEVFGSYPPIQEEMLHVYDPQIDEPVVCHGALSGKKVPVGEDHWEMDARLFYTQVLMGNFDSMLNRDFYGNEWVFGSPKRALYAPLSQDEFLASYEADFGYVFISGINFAPLKLHLGINELCSWWKFARTNPEKVERMVPCASVIHFTRYIVDKMVENINTYSGNVPRWTHGMSEAERWLYIQHEILCIKNVYYYHGLDERTAIRRFDAYAVAHPELRMAAADRLSGLVIQEGNGDKVRYIRDKLKLAYVDLTKMFRNAGMDEKEARSATKMEFNRAIGIMKNGQYMGSVSSFAKTDVMNAKVVDGVAQYTFESIPMPSASLMQVCTRELPNTNKILSEMVHVTPVVLAGYPRSLRVDVLERARLVMDMLSAESNAFMVKTDAVFFKARYLPKLLAYVHEQFPGVFTDPESSPLEAHDFEAGAEECSYGGCEPNRFCAKHDPTDSSEESLAGMLPFKFIFHPAVSGEINNVAATVESGQQFRYCQQVDGDTSLLKLSNAGWESLRDATKPRWETVVVKTSELMPTVNELDVKGMLKGFPNQVMGEDETVFEDELDAHCHIQSGAMLYIGKSPNAQPYVVDVDARNELYLSRLFDKMDSFDGGFKLEGPPGAGKTYTVCEYIKRKHTECAKTVFFVATATHLTLAPYRDLNKIETDVPDKEKRIHVSTFSSLVGVFNTMKAVSANPRKWFKGKDRFSSRFVRETDSLPPGTPIMIFIDEYEMMQQCTEEILLYLSDMNDVTMVLLGDRYQTAAFGLGIRCTGDVVKTITQDKCIEFDLPFRNLSYEYQIAHRKACDGKPTMFLEQPLSDYTAISSRRDDVYQHCVNEIAYAYFNSAQENTVYRDPVVSLQNYKAIGVVTLDIMECVLEKKFMSTRDSLAFCGSNAFAMGAQETEFGSVDVETESLEERPGQTTMGCKMYHDKLNHMTGDPSSKGFLVGTYVTYKENFSYRSLTAFIPKIRDGSRRQEHVPMGQVMIFRGFSSRIVPVYCEDGNKRRTFCLEWGKFEKENGDVVILSKAEVRAYMYYPFCLYTGGVVGHTFNRYTMIKFSNKYARSNDYLSLKREVEDIENALGDRAWLSPVVKTLNVGVSRVTSGNQVNIIEIDEGGKGFWKGTLSKSPWHMLGVHGEERREAYKMRLDAMREVVVESTHSIRLIGNLESLF